MEEIDKLIRDSYRATPKGKKVSKDYYNSLPYGKRKSTFKHDPDSPKSKKASK